MSNELLRIIKKAALEAVESAKPCAVAVGTVVCAEPLAIQISSTLTLPKRHILLSGSVCKYKAELHTADGKNTMVIDNSPEVGEKVILLRIQGGQKYLVVDKVVEE